MIWLIDLERENKKLRMRNEQLTQELQTLLRILEPVRIYPPSWKMTPSERCVLNLLLYSKGVVTPERCQDYLELVNDSRIDRKGISVYILKLRRILGKHGFSIVNQFGDGYFIPKNDRLAINKLLSEGLNG